VWELAPLYKEETTLRSQKLWEITRRVEGNRKRVMEVGDIRRTRFEKNIAQTLEEIQNILHKKFIVWKYLESSFYLSPRLSLENNVPSLPSVLSCSHTPPPSSNPFTSILIPSHSVFFKLLPPPCLFSMFSFRTLKFHSPLRDGAVETFAFASVKQKSLQLPDRLLVCFVANCHLYKTYVAFNSVSTCSFSVH